MRACIARSRVKSDGVRWLIEGGLLLHSNRVDDFAVGFAEVHRFFAVTGFESDRNLRQRRTGGKPLLGVMVVTLF